LPNRRQITTFKFSHSMVGEHRYLASVAFFPDGRPAELFLNTDMRAGSESDVNASDAAVAISLALQYGCPLDVLRNSMKRNADGSPTGPLAHALDLIGGMTHGSS
jgi:hypothetical protein